MCSLRLLILWFGVCHLFWNSLSHQNLKCLFSSFCPFLYFCWASLIAHLVKNLFAMQKTWVQFLGWEDFPGEGNGNPLQHSCLENPMNRPAWQASPWGCKVRDDLRLNHHHSFSYSHYIYVVMLHQGPQVSEALHFSVFFLFSTP